MGCYVAGAGVGSHLKENSSQVVMLDLHCVQSMSDTNIYLKEIFHVWQFSELISEPIMFSVN